ncbi:hypothetical protein PMAYCL1PPCAC_27533, partial [Pristionchus mayeri]
YFRAEISFSPASNCGGTIKLTSHEDESVIYSPGYPKSYDSNVHCMWSIELPPGNFPYFMIEKTRDYEIKRSDNVSCEDSVQFAKLYFESIEDPESDMLLCDEFERVFFTFNVKSSGSTCILLQAPTWIRFTRRGTSKYTS